MAPRIAAGLSLIAAKAEAIAKAIAASTIVS
jgi:hypothetical protein